MSLFTAGQRIEMTGIIRYPDPLAPGERGTVTGINNPGGQFEQLFVRWDSGRTLMLVPEDYRHVRALPSNRYDLARASLYGFVDAGRRGPGKGRDRPCPCGVSHTSSEDGYDPDKHDTPDPDDEKELH